MKKQKLILTGRQIRDRLSYCYRAKKLNELDTLQNTKFIPIEKVIKMINKEIKECEYSSMDEAADELRDLKKNLMIDKTSLVPKCKCGKDAEKEWLIEKKKTYWCDECIAKKLMDDASPKNGKK